MIWSKCIAFKKDKRDIKADCSALTSRQEPLNATLLVLLWPNFLLALSEHVLRNSDIPEDLWVVRCWLGSKECVCHAPRGYAWGFRRSPPPAFPLLSIAASSFPAVFSRRNQIIVHFRKEVTNILMNKNNHSNSVSEVSLALIQCNFNTAPPSSLILITWLIDWYTVLAVWSLPGHGHSSKYRAHIDTLVLQKMCIQ